jgi:ParB/RepB/Spo0J family partition protein
MTAGAEITEDLKNSGEILYLPCVKLTDHPLHMGFYVESHLEGLLASIRESGLLEPVVVCPVENGEYRILSGHYRMRAVRRLRWKIVLCRVVACDLRTSAIIYCTSNLLTRGISAIEEAYMISRLVSEEKFTLSEVGKLWGRSKSWVSRRLALLVHLEPKLKKDLGSGHLSPRVAQELLRLPRGNEQVRVLALIRRGHLNKDEAAQLVSHWLHAGEEEKKSLEENGYPKGDQKPAVCNTDNGWAGVVEAHFSQCTQILTSITGLAGKQALISWWPMEAYQSFRDAAACLEDVLKVRLHGTGG